MWRPGYIYDASGQRVLKRSTSAGATSLTAHVFGLEEYGYGGTRGISTGQWHVYSLAGHLIGSTNDTSTTYDLTNTWAFR